MTVCQSAIKMYSKQWEFYSIFVLMHGNGLNVDLNFEISPSSAIIIVLNPAESSSFFSWITRACHAKPTVHCSVMMFSIRSSCIINGKFLKNSRQMGWCSTAIVAVCCCFSSNSRCQEALSCPLWLMSELGVLLPCDLLSVCAQ